MTQQHLHKYYIYTVCATMLVMLFSAIFSQANALPTMGGLKHCEGDYKSRTIQGACPAKPVQPIDTKCEPLIKKYNDALFVPIPHPDDKTVSLDSMVVKSTNEFRSRLKISAHEVNSAVAQMRELGDDETSQSCVPSVGGKPGKRCRSCEKIVEKGNNACFWRLEDGICSAGTAAAAAANPAVTGHAKFFNGEAENVCESQTTVPHAPLPYADKGAPILTVDGQRYTMPDDSTQLAMVMGQFDLALDAQQGTFDAEAFSPSSLGNIMNMMGLKMPFTTAGQFNMQAAKQFQPSLDGLLGSVQNQIMGQLSGSIGQMKGQVTGLLNNMTSQLNQSKSAASKIKDKTRRTEIQGELRKVEKQINDMKSDAKIERFGDIQELQHKAESLTKQINNLSSLTKAAGGGDIQKIVGQLNGLQGQLGQLSQIANIGNIPGMDQFSNMLSQVMSSLVGGFGFQIRNDLVDHLGKKIGPNVFNANAKHVYDRVMKSVAVRETPAYATYDPADYKPGQEKRMALALAKKTPEEVMQASDLKELIGNDAHAFVGGGGAGSVMAKVLPYVKNIVSMGQGVEKFLSNGEMSLGSFGLKLSGGNIGMESISSLMQGGTTIQQIKSNPFSQIFNATDMFAPRSALRLFPERDHVSPCMSQGGSGSACRVTKDYLPYPAGDRDLHAAYHPSSDNAMRCSGTFNDVIRVDVLNNRYREFNAHAFQRNTYNRWCKGDPEGCCITCTCPPKPCPPSVPCWSSACWGVPIGAESPPCAMRHDPVHDIGFDLRDPGKNLKGEPNRYCYHRAVQAKAAAWMKRTGGKVDFMGTPAKRIEEVCHDTAKPIPMVNKLPMGDTRRLASAGMQALEGGTFMEQNGRRRPYIALDTTGKELGQPGHRPNYFADAGSFIGVLTAGMQNQLKLAEAGKGPNRLATDNIVPDFGFRDGGLGIVKDVLAQGAGGSGGGQCCLGGLGGETGGGCGPNGAHPFGSTVELLVQQRRTAQWFNHACLPDYEKTWNILSASVMASQMTGTTVQRVIEDQFAIKSKDAEQADGALTRTVSWPGAFRGHYNAPAGSTNKAWPDGGGCQSAKKGRGLEGLAEKMKNDEVGACVVMLPRGGAKQSEKPGLPNLAVVTRGSKDEHGFYLDVVQTNLGTGPDRCGMTQAAGTRSNRRFRTDSLPDLVEKERKEAAKNAGPTVTDSCVHPWSECVAPANLEWVCFSEEENLCVNADAGGAGNNSYARNNQ